MNLLNWLSDTDPQRENMIQKSALLPGASGSQPVILATQEAQIRSITV
jgi:hypothetical protein